jgi:hypothetical protein
LTKVLRIQKWYAHHENETDDEIWATLTKSDYDTRNKSHQRTLLQGIHGVRIEITPTVPNLQPTETSLKISNFQRGVKPTLSDYHGLANQEVLKWIQELKAKFDAQGQSGQQGNDYGICLGDVERQKGHSRIRTRRFAQNRPSLHVPARIRAQAHAG